MNTERAILRSKRVEERRAAGQLLRCVRLAYGLTLEEVSEAMRERVTRLSDVERGFAPIRCDYVHKLASVYGLRPGELASVLQAASDLG